jgi:low affinity Fe/Cu permease
MAAPAFDNRPSRWLEQFSHWATRATGSTGAFLLALLTVVVWVATGPVFQFSDTWQLVINTGTTIVTFLMVFLIQRAQNKDALATQLKLNEVLAALKGASNRLINVEDLSEEEVRKLHERYRLLADHAKAGADPCARHSIEEEAPEGAKSPPGTDRELQKL